MKTHILVEEGGRRYVCNRVGVNGVMVVDVRVESVDDGVMMVRGVCIDCLNKAPDDRVRVMSAG